MTSTTIQPSRRIQFSLPFIAMLASLVLTLGVLLAMSYPKGWVAIVACVSIPLIWSGLRYPHLVVAFSIFLLFSNALVVAVKFHGMPPVVASLGLPAALGSVWLYHLTVRREPLVFPRAWLWALAFLGVQVLSAILSRHPDVALDTLKNHLIEGMGLFLIVCNVVRTRKCLEYVVVALLIAGSFLGGLSLYQQVTGTHRNDYGGFAQVPMEGKGFETDGHGRQRRSAGSLGEQNRYAQNLLMLIPLAVLPMSAACSVRRKSLYFVSALLISAGCILTFSRGAAVAFVILIFVMKATGYLRTRHLMMVITAALLFLLAFPQLLARMDAMGTLMGYLRADTGAQTEELDGAITGRATSILAAIRVTADHPVLGVGPGNFPLYYQEYGKLGGFRARQEDREAHILYLHLSSEFGLLGLASFLGMVGVTLLGLHDVWKTHRQVDPAMAGLAAGFAMALFAYLLTGLFLHFSFIRFFWIILALACSVSMIAASDERRGQSASQPGVE
ncbi:MAG: O-antigen ligase family protein [Candidatus Paceibacterota bacterium]